MEHEFYECPEYLSNNPAEVERTEEYEYEVQFCIFLLDEFYSLLQGTKYLYGTCFGLFHPASADLSTTR